MRVSRVGSNRYLIIVYSLLTNPEAICTRISSSTFSVVSSRSSSSASLSSPTTTAIDLWRSATDDRLAPKRTTVRKSSDGRTARLAPTELPATAMTISRCRIHLLLERHILRQKQAVAFVYLRYPPDVHPSHQCYVHKTYMYHKGQVTHSLHHPRFASPTRNHVSDQFPISLIQAIPLLHHLMQPSQRHPLSHNYVFRNTESPSPLPLFRQRNTATCCTHNPRISYATSMPIRSIPLSYHSRYYTAIRSNPPTVTTAFDFQIPLFTFAPPSPQTPSPFDPKAHRNNAPEMPPYLCHLCQSYNPSSSPCPLCRQCQHEYCIRCLPVFPVLTPSSPIVGSFTTFAHREEAKGGWEEVEEVIEGVIPAYAAETGDRDREVEEDTPVESEEEEEWDMKRMADDDEEEVADVMMMMCQPTPTPTPVPTLHPLLQSNTSSVPNSSSASASASALTITTSNSTPPPPAPPPPRNDTPSFSFPAWEIPTRLAPIKHAHARNRSLDEYKYGFEERVGKLMRKGSIRLREVVRRGGSGGGRGVSAGRAKEKGEGLLVGVGGV